VFFKKTSRTRVRVFLNPRKAAAPVFGVFLNPRKAAAPVFGFFLNTNRAAAPIWDGKRPKWLVEAFLDKNRLRALA